MQPPTTIKDIEDLISNSVQEDIHLDYKRSAALDKNNRVEISKDVSSFANSDGGILIYGVVEENNLPVRLDDGVDHTKLTREWLEQIISSNITPRIDGVRIFPIPISENTSVYIVEIPKSYRAPHQASVKKYYKRFNFESIAMEDYEINDVRNRQSVVLPLINIDFEAKSNHMLYITVSNVGDLPALHVSFEFPSDVLWISSDRGTPTLFTKGIEYFPPNKTFRFLWNFSHALFASQDERVRKINAAATYLHPQVNEYVTDEFHIDLEGYRSNSTLKSDVEELKDTVKEQLNNLIGEIKKLNGHLDKLTAR